MKPIAKPDDGERPRRRHHGLVRLAPYVGRQWRTVVVIVALTVVSSLSTALQPLPMKFLVDVALGDQPPPAWVDSMLQALGIQPTQLALVVVAALATLVLFVLTTALTVGLSWAWMSAGQRMVYEFAGELFARLQRLSLRFHARREVGDSLSRLTGDTWSVYTVLDALLTSPLQQLVTLTTVGILAWTLDPVLTLLLFLTAPPLAASARYFRNRLKGRALDNRVAQARVVSLAQQTLSVLPVVQAFSAERRNAEDYRRLADDAVKASQRNLLTTGTFNLVNGLTLTIGMAVVLCVGALRVLAGDITLGTLLVFIAYTRTIQSASGSLLSSYAGYRSATASMDRVFEVLDEEDSVRDAPGAVRLAGNVRGLVEFDRVWFGYEAGRVVLRDVSLVARPGEKVALVGRTGAGKSTLVSLVPRLFDPTSGAVRLDGVDLRGIRLADVRAAVGLVLQEPFLLPLSVADNIAYGRPGASREAVVGAAVAANADEFVRKLPLGYDTVIGERGATLSGGERQRIAIARALLKDAPVLILDEPTSALDAQTEASLLEALERLMRGRTSFVIAHRLSTIRQADTIYVLEHGQVIETGSHADLLAAGGHYHHLNELQHAGTTP